MIVFYTITLDAGQSRPNLLAVLGTTAPALDAGSAALETTGRPWPGRPAGQNR